ncbi:folate-binding protein YgfZ [Gluconobacter cerinus]|uniref:CAF17-like 4Fe-4S cluster assembly/insertion protein YgfZ n=1 Tax=Gluconobacter cerinus TaxID=38307 RepID=UPI001B8C498C|nr:folate-binding protein YgfZ [Gluconobacter cerinus]MBS1021145.1 folate-binding protein YgfZ [Gluconobacter cerinus]
MIELLPLRSVLTFSGADRASFLQGLITNDVQSLSPGNAVWSALLTPQGRWLSEFFLFSDGYRILMDCPSEHSEMLVKKLSRFRLRADVKIELTALHVIVGATETIPPEALCSAPDPRCESAGWRAIVSQPPVETPQGHDWLDRRLTLGLPDTDDFESEKTLALEANLDLLHGVSWKKGCYMGQELTARTHYRGLLRRRILPVTVKDGTFPEIGGILTMGDKEVGELRSRHGSHALALLRREAWLSPDLAFEGKPVSVVWPDWFPLEMRS